MDPKAEVGKTPNESQQAAENGEPLEEDDMHKTSPYVRTVVAIHTLRDRAKEAVDSLNEKGLAERVSESWDKTQAAVTNQTRKLFKHPDDIKLDHIPQKYGYVFRPKSFWELVLLSGTVCGIEFCYSAETAFVTPILLSLGLNIKFVTMIWCLSPLIGLVFTPILGSMSDSCESRMGRRRPFILLYSIGILLGLVLVPNGHTIGLALGDTYNVRNSLPVPNSITAFNDTHVILSNMNDLSPSELESMAYTQLPDSMTTANILDLIKLSDSAENSETSNKTLKLESDAGSEAKIRRKKILAPIQNLPIKRNRRILGKAFSTMGKDSAISIVASIVAAEEHPSLKDFLKSLFSMPKSLKILCLTNLFCWMSLVSYSLYFTDFVAECVFGGDPQAPEDSEEYQLYIEGVQFGCWGMALYSLSCAVYSYFIDGLVKKIGAKPTYIGGQLVYCLGMIAMAICRHKIAVILLSPAAGIMYATLFTMPYILIAHYHCTNTFSSEKKGVIGGVRGIGTDVAAVSSMVFLSQFTLSVCMGSIVELVGSKVATVCAAALLSGCGAISATQVLYLDI
ncbi:Proton-associated sugar transporter A like protein [Argiope bruennichi]|uniref:Proton-associated sugar transporter A like protein n=1 Tax=Argiope bruennichi TaxID=94029 RepID=A0A8T0EI45_ARGBR|nr:Proton-associated sugar transporter A like protein [Argiope bruennichi]